MHSPATFRNHSLRLTHAHARACTAPEPPTRVAGPSRTESLRLPPGRHPPRPRADPPREPPTTREGSSLHWDPPPVLAAVGRGVGDPELLKVPGGIFARPRRMSTGKKNATLKKSKRVFPPECGLRGQGPRLTMTRPVWLGHPRGAAEVRVARPRPGAYSEAASPARRAAAGPIWAGSGLQIIPTLPDCLLQTVW